MLHGLRFVMVKSSKVKKNFQIKLADMLYLMVTTINSQPCSERGTSDTLPLNRT